MVNGLSLTIDGKELKTLRDPALCNCSINARFVPRTRGSGPRLYSHTDRHRRRA